MGWCAVGTFAERLDEALKEKRLTNRAAARALGKLGVATTYGYVGQLRRGDKTNPTLEQLRAFAELTGKSLDWLAGGDFPLPVEDAAAGEEARRIRAGLAELGVRNIAERMTGLSDFSMTAIASMVEAMRVAERLDDAEADAVNRAWFDREDG